MAIDNWQVLIVEDEDDSAHLVSKILGYRGIQTSIVGNGYECIDSLNQYEFDLVIMDLAMPEKDGWETLMEIRANPATAHIPVVAITAYHSANVAQDAMQAGFDAYFQKPPDAASFVDKLEQIIET